MTEMFWTFGVLVLATAAVAELLLVDRLRELHRELALTKSRAELAENDNARLRCQFGPWIAREMAAEHYGEITEGYRPSGERITIHAMPVLRQ